MEVRWIQLNNCFLCLRTPQGVCSVNGSGRFPLCMVNLSRQACTNGSALQYQDVSGLLCHTHTHRATHTHTHTHTDVDTHTHTDVHTHTHTDNTWDGQRRQRLQKGRQRAKRITLESMSTVEDTHGPWAAFSPPGASGVSNVRCL